MAHSLLGEKDTVHSSELLSSALAAVERKNVPSTLDEDRLAIKRDALCQSARGRVWMLPLTISKLLMKLSFVGTWSHFDAPPRLWQFDDR
jgi:hypothetical protein